MADGFVIGPREGERVSPAMTLKVGDKDSTAWSMFEVVDTGPGFDVGAHLHRIAEELFYVLEGKLDLLLPSRGPDAGQLAGLGVAHRGRGGPRRAGEHDVRPARLSARIRRPGPARMIFLVFPLRPRALPQGAR